MNIGLIGSGGREHALALALTRNPQRDSLFVFGGSANPGIMPLAKKYEVGRLNDGDAIIRFIQENSVDLVVVGPEAPLMYGLVDRLRALGVLTVGPTKAQAQLEGNKGFMRDLLQRNVPGASPEWQVVR
ncbi:MAG TPA: phosphoribosylamine--glycine ligase, partial [Anaerolineaceae bacterium]|nr:phosphoribosylamine--glycine ligase [Anaerolineaceae bacterium]